MFHSQRSAFALNLPSHVHICIFQLNVYAVAWPTYALTHIEGVLIHQHSIHLTLITHITANASAVWLCQSTVGKTNCVTALNP